MRLISSLCGKLQDDSSPFSYRASEGGVSQYLGQVGGNYEGKGEGIVVFFVPDDEVGRRVRR